MTGKPKLDSTSQHRRLWNSRSLKVFKPLIHNINMFTTIIFVILWFYFYTSLHLKQNIYLTKLIMFVPRGDDHPDQED